LHLPDWCDMSVESCVHDWRDVVTEMASSTGGRKRSTARQNSAEDQALSQIHTEVSVMWCLAAVSTCTECICILKDMMYTLVCCFSHSLGSKKKVKMWCQVQRLLKTLFQTNTHTHTLFPGLLGWAGTRKVKPIWILLKQETEWQWHQLGRMQVCTLLQTDNHASTPPLSFYRPDALPAAQPTVSKHWRHCRLSTLY